MNEGHVAIATILATIGAIITMVHYRDLIFGSPVENRRRNARRAVQTSRSDRSDRSNVQNERSALPSAESASVQRSAFSVQRSESVTVPLHTTPSDILTLTQYELVSLATALQFHAAGQSKQASIEAAFQCSKGASQAWKRASMLFDIATGKAQPSANIAQN